MIKTVIGDIRDAAEDIICHQVNCQGVMGAGVAKAISTHWPEVKKSYLRYCRRFSSPYDLLGKVQPVEVSPDKTVLNIFGQLNCGNNRFLRYTDYTALTQAFDEIRNKYAGKSLAFPYGFGCGLANGDWAIVEKMLHTYFDNMDVTIYKLPSKEDDT